jgi:hypothetical protein
MRDRRHGGVPGGQFASATERQRDSNDEFAKTGSMDGLHAKMRSHDATHTTDPIPAPSVGHTAFKDKQYSCRIV